MAKANTLDFQLWDAARISDLLSVKQKYFMEHISTAVGFPQAIRLPTMRGGSTTPRWKSGEVIAWINSHQERRAA